MAKVMIQDIARELNMSRNTISKALKNDESVAESTRARIIQVACAMGYDKLEPEMVEFARRQKRVTSSGRYAVLMIDFGDDDFWQGVVWGITEEIRKANGVCFLVIATQEEVKKNVLPTALITEHVDGIMCITLFPESYQRKLETLDIPMVFFDKPRHYQCKFDSVILEGKESVYALTMDLIKKGREKIGFIGDITYCESLLDRYRGYRNAMRDAGKSIDERFCFTADADYFYDIPRLNQLLEGLTELPDAFVCANDWLALRVMQCYKRKGVAIPEHLAVTGFDNKRECLIVEPNLSSVNTTNRRIGMRMAHQLLWRIARPTMHTETVWISTTPCIRESSGE